MEEVVDLHEIIHEVIGMLDRTIDKRIEIKRKFNAHPMTTLGDTTQLQNVIVCIDLI